MDALSWIYFRALNIFTPLEQIEPFPVYAKLDAKIIIEQLLLGYRVEVIIACLECLSLHYLSSFHEQKEV